MLPKVKAKYRARLCGRLTWEQNKNSGNWQVAAPFEVSQGEHAGETITWIGTLHGTADRNGVTGEERVIASLQYMGWQGDDVSDLAELTDEQAMKLMPEEVELVCDVESYNGGEPKLKVQWVNKAGAGRFAFKDAATKNDMRSFAAQLKATVKASRQTNGVAPRTTTPANGTQSHPNAPVDPTDDIPF